ncbi:TrkA family potassium uptake protein [Clostridium sp. MD294]|uniref:potassium channel family protein n=1 Tax=Clostridium sp. MD294 TaxID=97138 RepID=UPI0002C9A64D|nr:TrkA family potassium uptake protein [Clostridium sp. MD294]NDO45538.1 TrkA family potassium uptake protein [Clostridium sp. MD294]USF30810.1 Ktr system potassium uptake protein A [Clostridium sp. MD294]
MVIKKQFAVLGLGRFGRSIAKTLSENGAEVLAVDNNMELVQDISEYVTHAVMADITDEADLRNLGLGNFDVVIIATGSHLESSVLAILLAKEMGVPYVIAKALDENHKKILEKIGVDRVILPEREMGVHIANKLLYGNFFELTEISDDVSIAEVIPKKEWIGKSIIESDIRAKYDLNIIAIRQHEDIIASPKPTYVICENDVLIVLGENINIQKFLNKKG